MWLALLHMSDTKHAVQVRLGHTCLSINQKDKSARSSSLVCAESGQRPQALETNSGYMKRSHIRYFVA